MDIRSRENPKFRFDVRLATKLEGPDRDVLRSAPYLGWRWVSTRIYNVGLSDVAIMGGPSGNYDAEHADHVRMRALLRSAFSAKRLRALDDRVADLVAHCLDELAAARTRAPHRPVDLHAHLSFPLPTLVLSELLGVPVTDREYFRDLSHRASRMNSAGDAAAAMADGQLTGGITELPVTWET